MPAPQEHVPLNEQQLDAEIQATRLDVGQELDEIMEKKAMTERDIIRLEIELTQTRKNLDKLKSEEIDLSLRQKELE